MHEYTDEHQEPFHNPLTREALEAVLGFRVLSWPGNYVTAFTHKSAVRFMNGGPCFEKLEFLGDAVLGFIIGKYLYDTYPAEKEGFLTQMRTKLVSGKALADIAHRMGLSKLIIMSPKAIRSGFNTNPRILEDVLESLIGAVFLDAGMVAARTFVLNIIHQHVDRRELMKNKNHKDTLMQYCQAREQPLPIYDSFQEPNVPGFAVRASGCGIEGWGRGSTKKEAEQYAAGHVLMQLGERVEF